jgi:hypothetical protein
MFADIHRRLKTLETAPRSSWTQSGVNGRAASYSPFSSTVHETSFTATEFGGEPVSVSVNIGPTGSALVLFGASLGFQTFNGAANRNTGYVGVALSGANVADADTGHSAQYLVSTDPSTSGYYLNSHCSVSFSYLPTGLLSGLTTFTLQFQQSNASSSLTVVRPYLLVVPL